MEKESFYQGWSQGSLKRNKKNVVRKQINAKSTYRRPGHENYQILLEKEIAKLQKQLKQEVDTHRTLERALTRSLGALPRFSPGLTTEVQKLVAEVAVLEEEVVHLEEYITFLHQGLLQNEGLHTGQVLKVRSERCSIIAEGQPSPTARQPHLTTVKRSSVITNLPPSTIQNMRAKPVVLGGSPTYGQPKQKLSRSASFRKESAATMALHGACYGQGIQVE